MELHASITFVSKGVLNILHFDVCNFLPVKFRPCVFLCVHNSCSVLVCEVHTWVTLEHNMLVSINDPGVQPTSNKVTYW